MKLVWTGPARADRKAIREYIARNNPPAALALDELFAEQASRLLDHPRSGRLGRISGTRELVAQLELHLDLRHRRRSRADTACPACSQAMAAGKSMTCFQNHPRTTDHIRPDDSGSNPGENHEHQDQSR